MGINDWSVWKRLPRAFVLRLFLNGTRAKNECSLTPRLLCFLFFFSFKSPPFDPQRITKLVYLIPSREEVGHLNAKKMTSGRLCVKVPTFQKRVYRADESTVKCHEKALDKIEALTNSQDFIKACRGREESSLRRASEKMMSNS